jgi:signal transduction histidine kinase
MGVDDGPRGTGFRQPVVCKKWSRSSALGRTCESPSLDNVGPMPSLLSRRLSRRELLASDAVLAVATALFCAVAAVEPPPATSAGWHEPGWVSAVAGALLAVPVALRRRWPVPATGAALLLATTVLVTAVVPFYAAVAPIAVVGLVLYIVGAEESRRRSVATVVICIVVVAAVLTYESRQAFGPLLVAWVLGACWTVGRTIRERRAFAARGVEQATAAAVDQERLRIARDLHDIVSHSMSMIAVKATVADHVADTNPQEMRVALQVISATSRDTLVELRRALGVLRAEAVLTPAPGLAELTGLVAATRSAGLTVDLQVSGDAAVPEAVASAAFRIIQEALTNVVKHARAPACRVEVEVGSSAVRISVADDGASPSPDDAAPAPGQGLIGMRERAALFGGSDFTAGPVPGGGWTVATTLRYAS